MSTMKSQLTDLQDISRAYIKVGFVFKLSSTMFFILSKQTKTK